MNNQESSHKTVYQQGDTLLIPEVELPKGYNSLVKDKNIIAYGEVTGHAHKLEGGEFTIFENEKKERYLKVVEPVNYRHDEHKAFKVDPGVYRIGVVRQWDYDSEESKKVVD